MLPFCVHLSKPPSPICVIQVMESPKVNKYEQQRLANIKQNADMLAALKIHSALTQLNALSKRQIRKYTKKPRNASNVVRSSLHCRGMAPQEIPTKTPKIRQSPIGSSLEQGAVKMSDALVDSSGLDDRKLIETILGVSKNSYVSDSTDYVVEMTEKGDNLNVMDSLRLGPQKIARFVRARSARIFSLCFLPSNEKRMIMVRGDYGNLGFWNVDSVDDGDRMYVYRPHSAPVSGIVFQHFSMSKGICGCDRFSSCSIGDVLQRIVKKDGYVGLMRGWVPRMLFHAPAAAICWSTDEAAKSFFQELNIKQA